MKKLVIPLCCTIHGYLHEVPSWSLFVYLYWSSLKVSSTGLTWPPCPFLNRPSTLSYTFQIYLFSYRVPPFVFFKLNLLSLTLLLIPFQSYPVDTVGPLLQPQIEVRLSFSFSETNNLLTVLKVEFSDVRCYVWHCHWGHCQRVWKTFLSSTQSSEITSVRFNKVSCRDDFYLT